MNDDVIDGEIAIEEPSTALAIPHIAPLAPIISPDEARAAMETYIEMCEAVLTPDDYQEIRHYNSNTRTTVVRRFKKKSAVKKLQTFWGVSVTTPEAIRDDLGNGHYGFRVRAVAVCKGGRTVEAWGGCSTQEEKYDLRPYRDEAPSKFEERQRRALARSYHDVLSTAETRASNRAAMNAIGVGGGEVTADEMQSAKTLAPKEPREPREHTPSTRESEPPREEFDRQRAIRRIFAVINEYAEVSENGVKLKDDDQRHNILLRLYAKSSFNDLNETQLLDFEKRLRTSLSKDVRSDATHSHNEEQASA